MIAAATSNSPSNNYGVAILFESGIYIFESGVYFAQRACSGVLYYNIYIYYDLQPEGTLFQPRAYMYTFKKLSGRSVSNDTESRRGVRSLHSAWSDVESGVG